MTITATLTLYVARRFLGATFAMLAGLTLLISLFDFIELLRRAAARPDAGFALVATIAGLRLPFVALQILPFAILLGGILAFWRLTRSS
ncbi:MAG: LptF/LptG family permease, partial [Paracraurococcus sp.]